MSGFSNYPVLCNCFLHSLSMALKMWQYGFKVPLKSIKFDWLSSAKTLLKHVLQNNVFFRIFLLIENNCQPLLLDTCVKFNIKKILKTLNYESPKYQFRLTVTWVDKTFLCCYKICLTSPFPLFRSLVAVGHGCYCLALLRSLPVAVYIVLVTVLRYHLFIWSVFSPKLLYESMHLLLTAGFCLFFIAMEQSHKS